MAIQVLEDARSPTEYDISKEEMVREAIESLDATPNKDLEAKIEEWRESVGAMRSASIETDLERCADQLENMIHDNPKIGEDHIWTEKHDHKGEAFTRDKDIMAHLEKHRDIDWSRQMMDTYEAPAAQREVDRLLETVESLLSDEAREWWDCDECGHGGGGLCPRCKDEAEFQ